MSLKQHDTPTSRHTHANTRPLNASLTLFLSQGGDMYHAFEAL